MRFRAWLMITTTVSWAPHADAVQMQFEVFRPWSLGTPGEMKAAEWTSVLTLDAHLRLIHSADSCGSAHIKIGTTVAQRVITDPYDLAIWSSQRAAASVTVRGRA